MRPLEGKLQPASRAGFAGSDIFVSLLSQD
jgi:hypothetical protein